MLNNLHRQARREACKNDLTVAHTFFQSLLAGEGRVVSTVLHLPVLVVCHCCSFYSQVKRKWFHLVQNWSHYAHWASTDWQPGLNQSPFTCMVIVLCMWTVQRFTQYYLGLFTWTIETRCWFLCIESIEINITILLYLYLCRTSSPVIVFLLELPQ